MKTNKKNQDKTEHGDRQVPTLEVEQEDHKVKVLLCARSELETKHETPSKTKTTNKIKTKQSKAKQKTL